MSLVLEKSPWLFLSLMVVGVFSVVTCSSFYRDFPNSVPKTARYEVETEHSIVMSLCVGINEKHSGFFLLDDPFLTKSTLRMSPTPLSYTTCLYYMSKSYVDASFLIAFMNACATAVAIFVLSSSYTFYHFFCVLLVLFNGGWAFILLFRVRDDSVDLVHDMGRYYHVPFYQIFFKFIVASKGASFALPMAIFSMALISAKNVNKEVAKVFIISGLLAALCPSFMTSASLFIFMSCNIRSIIFTFPFIASLGIKYFYSSFGYNPVWKEYQMNGVFFSQLWCWIEAFGPIAFMIYIFPFHIRNSYLLHHIISSLTSLAFCSFFRNGGYYLDNSLAVAATVYPGLVIAFVHVLESYVKQTKGNTKGFVLGVGISIVAAICFGGIISCRRQTSFFTKGMDQYSRELADFVLNLTIPSSTFVTPLIPMNPITFLTGRSIATGLPEDLWMRGEPFNSPGHTYLNSHELCTFMMNYKIVYLVEQTLKPIVSPADSLHSQFKILGENGEWRVMKYSTNPNQT